MGGPTIANGADAASTIIAMETAAVDRWWKGDPSGDGLPRVSFAPGAVGRLGFGFVRQTRSCS